MLLSLNLTQNERTSKWAQLSGGWRLALFPWLSFLQALTWRPATSLRQRLRCRPPPRVWGDTAVITAKLWGKGLEVGQPFEYAVWFSDTYVRTPAGWRYVFGQASMHLPKTPDWQTINNKEQSGPA